MIWQNGVIVNVDKIDFHLSMTAGMYASTWVFIVDNIVHAEENGKLLPCKIYLHFDDDKKYLSFFSKKAVPEHIRNIIISEIKRHEDSWIRAIRP